MAVVTRVMPFACATATMEVMLSSVDINVAPNRASVSRLQSSVGELSRQFSAQVPLGADLWDFAALRGAGYRVISLAAADIGDADCIFARIGLMAPEILRLPALFYLL